MKPPTLNAQLTWIAALHNMGRTLTAMLVFVDRICCKRSQRHTHAVLVGTEKGGGGGGVSKSVYHKQPLVQHGKTNLLI
jgi:hypothetical protein